ncbi:hypothetical protein [Luteococcus peritonei]|uniref:Uncharacterized protein n=1 Tax=Luteococcus peritonei TaxID=88874 RepID=A0ABW4RUB1_9ACTN
MTTNDRYNFVTREQVAVDEHDYVGTARGKLFLDRENVAGLTRGIVRADRPWLAARTSEA